MAPTSQDDLTAVLRTGPFHVALRAAIEARGLTLQRLRHRLAQRGLRIGVTSLSYWQQGLRRPERPESLRAVQGLEEILELPAGALTALLGRPRSRGRNASLPPGAVGYSTIFSSPVTLDSLLTALDGVAADRRLHTETMFETVHLDAGRAARRRETVQVVRAHADLADRVILVWRGEPGCPVEDVEIRPLENCRTGRVRRDADTALVVAELLFDHALYAGDTYVLRYDLHDPSGLECPEYERVFRYPATQYVLQMRFSPGALPVRCRHYTRRSQGAPCQDVKDLVLNAHRTVHLAETGVQPGVLGIRLDWP